VGLAQFVIACVGEASKGDGQIVTDLRDTTHVRFFCETGVVVGPASAIIISTLTKPARRRSRRRQRRRFRQERCRR
jgi:hypothetical protein